MPTDFSFVTDEGWEALKPKFERAEKKLSDKVRKKELTEQQARKLTDLMWSKYEHWSSGEGKKKKENQTVLQKTTKKAFMNRLARMNPDAFDHILDLIIEGTIQNSTVFEQALQKNNIPEKDFFDYFAEQAKSNPTVYPRQSLVQWNDKFSRWGFDKEFKSVMDATLKPVGVPPPSPAPRTAPVEVPPASPAKKPGADPALFQIEPHPWPQGVQAPPASSTGEIYRWYIPYTASGDETKRAGIVDNLNSEDVIKFAHSLQRAGYTVLSMKRLPAGSGPQTPAAPSPAAQAPMAPAPAPSSAPAAPTTPIGRMDMPDPSDPKTYLWRVTLQNRTQRPTSISPDATGAEMERGLKRWKTQGLTILEVKKMSIESQASIVVDDSQIRFAADDMPEEKFKNGTPIIFTEDVNLKFEALDAHGQIKKNMTGKIKRVEDSTYLIDIAGQLYHIPKLAAEHVMDVFAATVVPTPQEGAEGAPAAGAAPEGQASPEAAPAPEPAAGAAPQKSSRPANWKLPAPPPEPAVNAQAAIMGRMVVAEDGDDVTKGAIPDEFWDKTVIAGITYSTTTPDSAEDGDFADTGWKVGKDSMTIEDALSYARNLGIGPKSDYDSTRWWSSEWSTEDYGTGEQIEYSLHIDGLSEQESKWVNQLLGQRHGRAAASGRIVVSEMDIEAAKNSSIAESFAQGATKGKGNHMFIDGDTIYSYGKHFPIATRGPGGVFYLTTARYSHSTTMHVNYVRRALESSGAEILLSSEMDGGGKVAAPSPEETAKHEQEEAEMMARHKRSTERLRTLKPTPPESFVNMPGSPSEKTVGDTVRYNEEHGHGPHEAPALSSAQWQARIQDVEDQLLRETDPARQEKMRQRLERMKMASWESAMSRVASDDPFENSKIDVSDLHDEMKKIDKNNLKTEGKEPKPVNKMPHAASIKNQAFADLLMLIEQGGPGIPSEIGKRLYSADGAVSRVSA